MRRCAVLLMAVCWHFAFAAESAPAVLAAHVDRVPDDADWAQAPVFELTQQDPHPGAPTPYATRVRALADRNTLYVRIDCDDPDFARRSVHTLLRDADQSGDDHVTIVLDTFGTQRTAYLFQVNAAGARSDGLISPASRKPSFDWDGVWDAHVQTDAHGWSAQLAIDVRYLQFRRDLDHWGFNVQRYVPREQLSLQWADIALDASIFNLRRTGTLEGVADFAQGAGIEVAPYALARYANSGNGSAQVGGDVRYNVTPDLALIATFNPDFAEAEADAQQINLTRYSLFYPEKRRFFLEGSNLFTFAAGLNEPDRDTVFIPFYSRRVGLRDGATVRLDEGVKVIGQQGPWAIGALDVETGRSGNIGPTNLFAGHLTYDVDEHLRIGTMLTRGDPAGATQNRFAGLDAVWQTSTFRGDKNLTLAGWAARTNGDTASGQHSAWGLYAQYPNDLWRWYASINVFGDAFDPALGFLPRPGTRQYDVYIDYRPRPNAEGMFGWARQFFYEIEVQQFDDLHGGTQTRRIFTAPFNVDTESGEHFEFDWIPDLEALTAPFAIADNVTLPIGRYHFDRYRFEAQSSDARPLRIGNVLEVGTFYDGRLTQMQPFVNWTTLGGKLSFQLSNETDFAYLREGNFIQRLYQFKVAYSFTPDLSVDTFAQYDSGVGHTGVNARLHWIVAPGRDFFLVFNHGVETSVANPLARLAPVSNALTAKLRWDFRW